MSKTFYHIPVLLNEVLEGLNIRPNGVYVDATMGGAGHSKAILQQLDKQGRLFAFDQDRDAIAQAPKDEKIQVIYANFQYMSNFLKLYKVDKQVDGIMADLGISSYQIDTAERGFSIRFDGCLDMRMNVANSLTARDILKNYSQEQLQNIFENYGDIPNARQVATHIVQIRKTTALETTNGLLGAVEGFIKGNKQRYLAQLFQAIRMEVNHEMEVLKIFLYQAVEVLKTGGRLCVITFHSIEDRVVKQFMKEESYKNNQGEVIGWKLINKKTIVPAYNEIRTNRRSASAKLRIIEKI